MKKNKSIKDLEKEEFLRILSQIVKDFNKMDKTK
mgnify:CR=1 FL=1